MTTARSFGNYDLAAALADLIDNSIQANARNVWVEFDPADDDVIVRICDDGRGMTLEVLIDAMRPASRSPEEKRDALDLGRFGWGLKSASLSQARVLTVVSWNDAGINAARWDIDNIDNWSMDIFQEEDALDFLESKPLASSGTEVIWAHCDRLYDKSINATIDERLNEKISHARKQLSLIFHRYLSGESDRPLSIYIQSISLSPVDPFMTAHPATQSLDGELIQIRGGEHIQVKPYVIPHFSKLTVSERLALGGEEGLVRNQGFYVYRNKRLIIYGTWFRLVPHSELSQLTRVRIDLPNSLDAEWKITLDKSDAQLPPTLRKRLRAVVQKFSKRSVGVHRRKGVDLNTIDKSPVWRRNAHNNRIRYLINRDHPIIREILTEAGDPFVVNEAIRLLEAYVPIDVIQNDLETSPDKVVQAITDPSEFDSLIVGSHLHLDEEHGRSTGF
ncbi:ATP-binding protein [Chromobacterium aquaticum]|uniref:ATP-binding protein n=1 Tax=Chromobacterium aquaticum TaxID=467180 RepID=A0ABV8ZTY9_9NEIS|nr:ATP-binding protein [Chromobacterium aquaticum]MCD5361067.1 ATP-binding protein [Chromobacterium aquaticum]